MAGLRRCALRPETEKTELLHQQSPIGFPCLLFFLLILQMIVLESFIREVQHWKSTFIKLTCESFIKQGDPGFWTK